MAQDNFDYSGRSSGGDRRSQIRERSAEERLLNGEGRFKRHSEIANVVLTGDEAPDRRETAIDRRSDGERRSGADRRSGFDSRSEVEQFLQGEQRSGQDRRSRFEGGYQTFKKARAFVRSLQLKSMREWYDYIQSDAKPDTIPANPHQVYANHGWVGWNDWLGASPVSNYLSLNDSFKKAREFVHRLGLLSNPKPRACCNPVADAADLPANPEDKR